LDLEEQILRYYLKVFSFLSIFVFYFIYIFFIKEILFKNEYFIINKSESYKSIIENNIIDYSVNIFFYKLTLKILLINKTQIHYGKFRFDGSLNFIDVINIITSPSNYYEKITIVEGWSKKELNKILENNFEQFDDLDYSKIIADTYMFSKGSTFNVFKINLENKFHKLKEKNKNNELLKKFSFKEILIIGSLLEKEGLNYIDKKKIFSVIINRLNNKMKLQIDATVIYAITEGNKKFDRKLTFNDLKIKHDYNTYVIFGLPPEPISYVGYKTIELIFENYKTDYLFYFYNSRKGNHVFSKNYKDHLMKLNEYRSN